MPRKYLIVVRRPGLGPARDKSDRSLEAAPRVPSTGALSTDLRYRPGLPDEGVGPARGASATAPEVGPANKYPHDIRRLRTQYFASDDQLLTLALATAFDPAHWAVAREVGAPITLHVNGTGQLVPLARHMGRDCTYIHCCNLDAREWTLIAETGGGVSIAAPIEMEMGHGVPPFQPTIDHNIPWSLSNDVETEIPTEFFTQMRTAFFLQRMRFRARAGRRAERPAADHREAGGGGRHHRRRPGKPSRPEGRDR